MNKIASLISSNRIKSVPVRTACTNEGKEKRIKFVEDTLNKQIPFIKNSSIPANILKGNIESYIGSVEVPIGLAGPLLINGQNAKDIFYAPIATTEGALISSITRGSRLLTAAGGVSVTAINQKIIRAPLFVLSSIKDALFLSEWIIANKQKIEAIIAKHSNHAKLIAIEPVVLGKKMHVKFVYKTGDASGQNMTTKCTDEACKWIRTKIDILKPNFIKTFLVDSNMSSDKKVSFQSFINGRGMRVCAEAIIKENHIKRILHTDKDRFLEAYHNMNNAASSIGMIGFNINITNVIAGMYIATGQDVACVHESGLGSLSIEPTDDGLYCSMTLPNLIVGTIGGGTGLPHQKEALELLGCYGKGKVAKLAEIICSFCLALDISTLAAVSSGDFTNAHENYGRNKPATTIQPN